jgi:hypothetical protein
MENKQCTKCKQHLPLTKFHKDKIARWFKSCDSLKEYLVLKIVKRVYLKRDMFDK